MAYGRGVELRLVRLAAAAAFAPYPALTFLPSLFIPKQIHNGLTDVVVPLPQTSKLASVILRHLNITADFVHVDAAHECEATWLPGKAANG